MFELKEEKIDIVNRFKLIYLPLFIGILAIITVSMVSYYVSKRLLYEQMKQDGINLAKFTASKINNDIETLDNLNELLGNRLRTAGKLAIEFQDQLSNEFLMTLAKNTDVDEIHWYNSHGEIAYTTQTDYLGIERKLEEYQKYFKDNEFVEVIQSDFVKKNIYGYFRNNRGSIVQIGITLDASYKYIDGFNFQNIVDNLAKDKNIEYALILNTSLKAIADSDYDEIGLVYANDPDYMDVLSGNIVTMEWYYDKIDDKVLEIAVPIYIDREIKGIIAVGLSLNNVFVSIFQIFFTHIFITIIMVLLLLWVQNKNIIKPINKLNENIKKIDIEKNRRYRIPNLSKDMATFYGLTNSINKILDKIDDYFMQLSISREEIRDKYKEVQDYAERLEDLKQKYDIAIQGTNSAIWEINVINDTIHFSDNMVANSEHLTKENNFYEIVEAYVLEEDKERIRNEYHLCKKGRQSNLSINIRIRNSKDKIIWYLVRGKGILDKKKRLKSIHGIVLDITTLKEQEAYIETFAFYDSLTNLPNRRLFIEQLKDNLIKKRRGAVLLLDLDNFKGINDTLGHIYGDRVLKQIADDLLQFKNDSVLLTRFGGDEFLILLIDDNISHINQLVQKIYEQFNNNKILIDDNEIYISFSIGVTLYPQDSDDVSQLIMNADLAMYEAKMLGKNNVVYYHQTMLDKINEKIKVENILRNALKDNNFKLLFQPQVRTKTGETTGYEALIRLNNKNLSPALFIPVAEETGMIIKIGRWVTETVIQQLAMWKQKGLPLKSIALNFSAKQLNDIYYIKFLENKLREYDVEAKYIEIEITENLFLENKDKTVGFLMQLKELGVRIAIDDFGTGYSSLNYLTFLPVDKIKLDKSFNDKYLECKNIKIIEGIISLAHSLDLEVVAEGIEVMLQFEQLAQIGCDYIQGYLFRKPMEMEQVISEYGMNYLEVIK